MGQKPQHTIPEYDLFVSYSPADREWVADYLLDALSIANVRVLSDLNFARDAADPESWVDAIDRL